ncbi:hypothetical protein pdul_cds_365 [Pandoravirus dulcis]|uniref:Uncharacterized protein n=1 Tax=Pandoravirus dulcis TaxID=1349409 RepID=S4VQ39_9VIRU|nr:hypothetical protein pdul_cds_365 [Pandoravirus dulcis]AGO82392.1 hypothetical protein pdul_cds_365 [Pandoravirus dulcis]
MLANSGDNKGNDIGSSSLPATRPLCIPVRFQPLGGATASRWMGTGALAAAASTLPPPLPACDERNSTGGDPFDMGGQVPPSSGGVWACAPADGACGTEPMTTAAAPYDGSVQVAGSSRLTDRPWLWPLVVALVLALAVLGGGAAWATWQRHRRQRLITAAPAAPVPSQPDAIASPLSPVLGMPAGSAAPVPPLSPLFQATDPYSAATPVFYGAHSAPLMTVPEPHQASYAHTQQQPAPMSPLAQPPQQQQQPPHAQQQQQPPHAVAQTTQPQARGTYMMVERPPLRMRNVAAASRRHGDSDDDDDQSHDAVESGRRAPARPVASGPRVGGGGGGGDPWSQRAFSRRPMASPQESHLEAVRPVVARQPPHRLGCNQAFPVGNDVVGRPHEADMTGRPHSGSRVGAGDNRGGEASGDDDDDSLGDGVADYWADADRARQIYFASPEERAAQVVRLGPQAYSPDGTPMPARLH